MQKIQIYSNWNKLNELIKKDSIIQILGESGVKISDNVVGNTIRYSTYNYMESFKVKKDSNLWISSCGASALISIQELKTEEQSAGSGSGGFPAGSTKYKNIEEIEEDISEINSKIADLGTEIKVTYVDLGKNLGMESIYDNLTKAFESFRKGYSVYTKNLNGFENLSLLNLGTGNGLLEITPIINNSEYFLKVNIKFPYDVKNVTNMETFIKTNDKWEVLDKAVNIYDTSKWRFYGNEEVLVKNTNLCKYLMPNINTGTQMIYLQELGINLDLKIFKEVDIYYTMNNNFYGSKITITKNSSISNVDYDDSSTFSNSQRQMGTLLYKGNLSDMNGILLKIDFAFPSAYMAEANFCIKKVIGRYY